MINLKRSTEMETRLKEWVESRYLKIAIFNIIIVIFVLLRSAGYFEPFFLITINLIVFLSLILAILLLGVGSNFLFSTALTFWIFAFLMKMFGIDVWAERTSIYTFQALILGTLMIIFETFKDHRKIKQES